MMNFAKYLGKLVGINLTVLLCAEAQRERPQISRLLLEDTPPRSIAIGYKDGVNVVFNSVNMTPLYMWKGGFIDERHETKGRGGNACSVEGPKVTFDIPDAPLRFTNAESAPKVITFNGYDRPKGMPPVFFASVDGNAVSFTITSPKDGQVSINYKFSSPIKSSAYFLTGAIDREKVLIQNSSTWNDGVVNIPAGASEFSIGFDFAGKKAQAPKVRKKTGEQLYGQYCTACHSISGHKMIGPSFKQLFGSKRKVITDGKEREVLANDGYLLRSIISPEKDIVKGYTVAPMPSFKDVLNKEEIDKLIDFIKTIK